MDAQKFVVVRNLKSNMNHFTDHQGVSRMLGPVGEQNDSIKLILEGEDENRSERSIRMYTALKVIGGLEVKFSDAVDVAGVHILEPKLVVVSTADVDQAASDRVTFLRKEMAQKSVNDRLEQSRKLRLDSIKTSADNAAEQAAQPTAKPVEASRAPMFEPDEGKPLTEETIMKMDKGELYEIAAQLSIPVKKGSSLGGLRKAILLTMSSKG